MLYNLEFWIAFELGSVLSSLISVVPTTNNYKKTSKTFSEPNLSLRRWRHPQGGATFHLPSTFCLYVEEAGLHSGRCLEFRAHRRCEYKFPGNFDTPRLLRLCLSCRSPLEQSSCLHPSCTWEPFLVCLQRDVLALGRWDSFLPVKLASVCR